MLLNEKMTHGKTTGRQLGYLLECYVRPFGRLDQLVQLNQGYSPQAMNDGKCHALLKLLKEKNLTATKDSDEDI